MADTAKHTGYFPTDGEFASLERSPFRSVLPNPKTGEQVRRGALNAGMTPVGPNRFASGLPVYSHTPSSGATQHYTLAQLAERGRPSMLDQLSAATQFDFTRTMDAASRLDKATAKDIAGVEAAVNKLGPAAMAGTNAAITQLEGDATGLRELGASQVKAFGEREEAAFAKFDDSHAANMSAIAMGLQRQWRNQSEMIDNGLGPDGTPLTLEQQFAMKTQLREQTSQTIASTIATEASRFNEARMAARQGYEGLRGGVLQGQRDLHIAAANIGQTIASLKKVNELEAVQLEIEGRTALADLRRRNPTSVVSLFSSLATLYQVATAPGAQNRRGFNFAETA